MISFICIIHIALIFTYCQFINSCFLEGEVFENLMPKHEKYNNLLVYYSVNPRVLTTSYFFL